ncbi:methylated-DNA--[protein]-cysteine S-methyltransferase [Corynebacterium sphenisci]|uniref:methylated-DNA--[protein]-cysteine S-methyltransferase n=1 Tax=Corynebacterium sphenisci TaxID=191493 RepID=UPI0026E03CE2|nr:methylated-DNA--[protein]-cysteine S-methyltransferase [Corynebacterium sphenisci]MDO5731000.1 methylated-DNA--[protein]-cysteine S-methyltransferase [Corynebacterium sphenisci]
MAHRIIDTPVGPLRLLAGPAGLRRVDYLARLRAEADPAPGGAGGAPEGPARAHLDAAAAQLAEYFAGRRRRFDLTLDCPELAGGSFRARALRAMAAIPYGSTLSYGELAAAAGSPRAARAAGSACSGNPLSIIVGCHRVLPAGGGVGAYGGGVANKRRLLDFEAGRAPFPGAAAGGGGAFVDTEPTGS